MKKSFLVALFATFATFVQAQELKRGGYEVGELTKQWTDQGYELVKGYDDVNDLDYYRLDTEHATSYFYLTHNNVVSSSYIWPLSDDALSAFIDLYNRDCEIIVVYQWKIKTADGITFINLLEDEGEYYFEFIYTLYEDQPD